MGMWRKENNRETPRGGNEQVRVWWVHTMNKAESSGLGGTEVNQEGRVPAQMVLKSSNVKRSFIF